jgi:hypothetical protein
LGSCERQLHTCHVVDVFAGQQQQQRSSASGSQASGAESGGGGGNILIEDEDAANAATQRLLRGAIVRGKHRRAQAHGVEEQI